MLSYRQYQAQYYYYPDVLKEELEERMNIPVEVTQVDTDKKKSKRNVNNIWEIKKVLLQKRKKKRKVGTVPTVRGQCYQQ